MKKVHNCEDVVQQFNMLLDGELNPKEEQDVMCELQRCIQCLQEYNLEEKFRDFVKTKFEKKCCSASLLGKIKNCNKE